MQHVEAIAAIARRMNFRTKSVQALPIDRKARQLAQLTDVSDAVATRALIAYHFSAQRPMMAAFLNALGVANDNGLITADDVHGAGSRAAPGRHWPARGVPTRSRVCFISGHSRPSTRTRGGTCRLRSRHLIDSTTFPVVPDLLLRLKMAAKRLMIQTEGLLRKAMTGRLARLLAFALATGFDDPCRRGGAGPAPTRFAVTTAISISVLVRATGLGGTDNGRARAREGAAQPRAGVEARRSAASVLHRGRREAAEHRRHDRDVRPDERARPSAARRLPTRNS